MAFPAAPAVALPVFDLALGTSTRLTLTLDARAGSGTIAWDNEALVSTDITRGVGAEVTAMGLAGIPAVAVPLQLGSGVGIDADNDSTADLIGADAFAVTGGAGIDSASDVLTVGLGSYRSLRDVASSGRTSSERRESRQLGKPSDRAEESLRKGHARPSFEAPIAGLEADEVIDTEAAAAALAAARS